MGSDLNNKIQEDFTRALKNHETDTLSVLRLLRSEMKNKAIDKGDQLTDTDIIALIKKAVKERNDSIEQYTKASRPELAAKEEAEVAILKAYLPDDISESEIAAIIDSVLKNHSGEKNFGMVMKEVMSKVQAVPGKSADGSVVSRLVKEKLQ